MNTPPTTAPQTIGTPCHRPFAIAAWVLFAVSFVLPSFKIGLGWQCAAAAVLSSDVWEGVREGNLFCIHCVLLTLPNLFMLTSPVFILMPNGGVRTLRWMKWGSAISVLLTTTFMLYFAYWNSLADLHLGYFVWIFSFALLGLSFFRGAVTVRDKPSKQPFLKRESMLNSDKR